MASQKSSDIDYNDFAQLRRVAIAYAMKKGLTDEQMCEDFGQEYCLAVWLKKNGSMSIEFCNFLRKYYGRNDKQVRSIA
jgi:hypothetical protein